MKLLSNRRLLLIGSVAVYVVLALAVSVSTSRAQRRLEDPDVVPQQANGPATSGPIAITQNDALVFAVNPEDDSVSVINTANNTLAVSNVRVGDEPQAVAVDPAGQFAYVANAASNSLSILQIQTSPTRVSEIAELITGAEPWSVVVAPDGQRVYVANAGQDTITVINASTRAIIGDVNLRSSSCNVGDPNRHFQPRGLALTADGSKLFVARFFSFTKEGGKQADDTGKEGIVCRLSLGAGLPTVDGPIALQARDTGFKVDKNADGTPDDTSAYPNQLQSIVLRGTRAYLPNIAASPAGPLRFNVDTQAFVNVIDNVAAAQVANVTDVGAVNLHLGARDPEPGKDRLFFANVWGIAFTNQSGAGSAYVVSAGSDLLVKLSVDAAGVISFTGDVSTTRYIDLNDPADPDTAGEKAGKNPLGIAMNSNGSRAYVMNFLSRNVSVVDIASDAVVATVKTTELPPAGSLEETLLAGAEVFFSSRGHFDGGKSERLSSEGWQACGSCHFQGLTDANVWAFGAGPRKSVQMNGTWDPRNADDQRMLNYSGIFDEVQDFELNIRNVSGPGPLSISPTVVLDPNHGLLIGNSIDEAPNAVVPFNVANAGRPQLTITLPGSGRSGIPALDAMKEWVRFNIRTPNGPLTDAELPGPNQIGPAAADIAAGQRLFLRAGCQSCHGGGKWTNSVKDFVSPPTAGIFTERNPATFAPANPIGAQFFQPVLEDIGSFGLGTAANPLGNNIGPAEKTDNGVNDALGIDHNKDGKGEGYNVPSILGTHASPPYYHNGACETIACVLTNVEHRTAGLRPNRSDELTSAQARARLAAFVESIDFETQPLTNLSIRRHDIASDGEIFVGIPVTLTANIKLFGPKVPTFDDPITVSFFDGDRQNGTKIGDATITGIPDDNGQVTVAVQYTPPSNPGLRRITVVIDPARLLDETSEQDNIATRAFAVRPIPGDRTRPVVTSVVINNDAVTTNNRTVSITFNAEDPTSPSPSPTSGLKDFCVTSYFFNSGTRQFIPQPCVFKPLTGNAPFTIEETLPSRDGLIYAFVTVRDVAGNTSRPGFDFINVVPGGPIELANNKSQIFRIRLNNGQSTTFTATPTTGDVDVSVFSGGNRVAVSAQVGTVAESVTFASTADNTIFTIEVRSFANSRFTVGFSSIVAVQGGEITQTNLVDPGRETSTVPPSGAPPALNAAFADLSREITLPVIVK